jgi:hypothetical protein
MEIFSRESVAYTGSICQSYSRSRSPRRVADASIATLMCALGAYSAASVLCVAVMTLEPDPHANGPLNSLHWSVRGDGPLRFCDIEAIFGKEGSISFKTVREASTCPRGLPVGQVDTVGFLCCVSGSGR